MPSQLFFPFDTNKAPHGHGEPKLYDFPETSTPTANMPPGLRHFPHADQAQLHLYGENKDIWIGDVNSSIKDDPSAPMASGFFTLEKGCKTTTTFGFSEMKYVIQGSVVVSDSNGQRFTCRVGDIFYIPKGATITFETEEGGKAFYVAQRDVNPARMAGKLSKL